MVQVSRWHCHQVLADNAQLGIAFKLNIAYSKNKRNM